MKLWLSFKNLPVVFHFIVGQWLLKMRNKPVPILIHPHKSLSTPAKEVDFTKTSVEDREKMVLKMGRALQNTTYGQKLGLAATQIGIPYRIAIVQGNVLFNPTWKPTNAPPIQSVEACYSVPDKMFKIARASYGWGTWKDIGGVEHSAKIKGEAAVIYQHELDHLNGKCCADVGTEITT